MARRLRRAEEALLACLAAGTCLVVCLSRRSARCELGPCWLSLTEERLPRRAWAARQRPLQGQGQHLLQGQIRACLPRRRQLQVPDRTSAARRATEEPPRWDPTAPVFTEEELEDGAIGPEPGEPHECTLIYLHAFGRCGKEYIPPLLDRLSPGFPAPWVPTADFAPGLRVVLPTARRLRLQWGPMETSWHDYVSADSNDVGDPETLRETRQRLATLVREEIDLLAGRADRLFLGGLSQGCTAALDVYLREGPRWGLGGFVGSVGFLPSDATGFAGATEKTELLIASAEQSQRPMWLQCATDDQWVPWRSLAEPSFDRLRRDLPGFKLRTVSGRGHIIDDWEGTFLEEFLRAHAEEAYAPC